MIYIPKKHGVFRINCIFTKGRSYPGIIQIKRKRFAFDYI